MMPEIHRQKLIDTIVSYAEKDLGIQEIKGNQGWFNPDYDRFMRDVLGFVNGHSWCVYAAIRVWLRAYSHFDSLTITKLLGIFTPHAQGFFNRCNASEWIDTSRKEFEPGDIVIWQRYKDNKWTQEGHAGVVLDDNFTTFEGNTNLDGDRDGGFTAIKHRDPLFTKDYSEKNGLFIKGFIKAPLT